MFTQVRSRTNPYRLYIGIEVVSSFVTAIAFTTAIVYRVRSGHLNPLQLVLLGTAVEISYLVMQLPSGVLADLVSRRLCVIAGQFLEAVGILMQGLSPHFAVQLTAQIPVGFGAALTFGAQEAWLADETGNQQLTSVFLRAAQFALVGTLIGSMLSGALALTGARCRSWPAGACSPPWRWCSPGSCPRQGSGPRPGLRASAASPGTRGAG